MNAYYQYAINKGYSNADAAIAASVNPVGGVAKEEIVKQGIVAVYAAPKPVSQPISQTVSNPIQQTVAKPVSQPISQTVSKPVSKPISQTVSQGGSNSNSVLSTLPLQTVVGTPSLPASNNTPTGTGINGTPTGTGINDVPLTSSSTVYKPAQNDTINIFPPVSDTTSGGDVLESIGGGGGGGGGGMFGAEEEGAAEGASTVIVKTWIPLIVVLAGVAVIIFKPFKK